MAAPLGQRARGVEETQVSHRLERWMCWREREEWRDKLGKVLKNCDVAQPSCLVIWENSRYEHWIQISIGCLNRSNWLCHYNLETLSSAVKHLITWVCLLLNLLQYMSLCGAQLNGDLGEWERRQVSKGSRAQVRVKLSYQRQKVRTLCGQLQLKWEAGVDGRQVYSLQGRVNWPRRRGNKRKEQVLKPKLRLRHSNSGNIVKWWWTDRRNCEVKHIWRFVVFRREERGFSPVLD